MTAPRCPEDRIAVGLLGANTASEQIVVVLHWFEELKRLVPTK